MNSIEEQSAELNWRIERLKLTDSYRPRLCDNSELGGFHVSGVAHVGVQRFISSSVTKAISQPEDF